MGARKGALGGFNMNLNQAQSIASRSLCRDGCTVDDLWDALAVYQDEYSKLQESMATGEWLNYPENMPEIQDERWGYLCKCKIPVDAKIPDRDHYFDTCSFDNKVWTDGYCQPVEVIEFAEIRRKS